MAHVTIYLPDDLAREARGAGLNISKMTQEALSDALALGETDRWLDRLERLPRSDGPNERVIEAINSARAEFGGHVRASREQENLNCDSMRNADGASAS